MKKNMFLFTLFLLFQACKSSSQVTEPIEDMIINFDEYHYLVEEDSIFVCEIKIKNLTDKNHIIWFDKKPIYSYNEKRKIRSYFLTTTYDFNLFSLLSENLSVDQSPILFVSFLKKIITNEEFIIRVIGDSKITSKCKKFIEEHFVSIKQSTLEDFFKMDFTSIPLYNRNVVDFKEKFLNKSLIKE